MTPSLDKPTNNNAAPQVKVTPTEKLLRKKFDPLSLTYLKPKAKEK